jgi:hypothetical protein
MQSPVRGRCGCTVPDPLPPAGHRLVDAGLYEAEMAIDNLAAWETYGHQVNLTIMNGPDLITKLIAAMQVGDVPDLVTR